MFTSALVSAGRLVMTQKSRPALHRMLLSSSAAVSTPSVSDAAIEKARTLFAEYRETHYRQCLPSRFRKEVMRAAVIDPTKDADRIDMDGLRRVFANIGALDRISENEIQLIFDELGNEVGEIDIPRFKKLVCP